MGNVLAWCEGACTIHFHLLIGPGVRGSARAGCLLLGRQDPCCIHYGEVAAISCSGRTVVLGFLFVFFSPAGSLWGGMWGVLEALAPELG